MNFDGIYEAYPDSYDGMHELIIDGDSFRLADSSAQGSGYCEYNGNFSSRSISRSNESSFTFTFRFTSSNDLHENYKTMDIEKSVDATVSNEIYYAFNGYRKTEISRKIIFAQCPFTLVAQNDKCHCSCVFYAIDDVNSRHIECNVLIERMNREEQYFKKLFSKKVTLELQRSLIPENIARSTPKIIQLWNASHGLPIVYYDDSIVIIGDSDMDVCLTVSRITNEITPCPLTLTEPEPLHVSDFLTKRIEKTLIGLNKLEPYLEVIHLDFESEELRFKKDACEPVVNIDGVPHLELHPPPPLPLPLPPPLNLLL